MMSRNFAPFPILKTHRLVLRQLSEGDVHEIFALRSDRSVNRYLDRAPSKGLDDAGAFIRLINENIQKNLSVYWAIALNDADRLIGTICLFSFSEDNLTAEIGYELLPGFQKKGIMEEAASKVIDFGFKNIQLHSIEAHTHPENQGSTRLLEKLNFKKRGSGDGNVVVFELSAQE